MSVFGVDFGNLNSTVAITRCGGVDIVTNEVSRRETTTIVSFSGEERFIGEQGLDRYVRNSKNTVFLLKRFIGMRMEDPNLERELRFVTCEVKGDASGRLMFGVDYCDETKYFYPEQVLAMMLQRLRSYVNDAATTEARFPADVRDCVVTVPSYYTADQRQLVYQACEIAGVNAMSLINETTAAAVDYGIFRGASLKETEEEGQLVGILDFGYAATDFAITKFWRGNCKVIARTFDRNNGTRDIDWELFKYISDEIMNKYKINTTANKKTRLRVLQGCERVKYLLSANQSAPYNVENVEDVDISFPNFQRATLEELSGNILETVRAVIQRALDQAGITVDQLHSIELIGGGCRIPMVKRLIEEILGRPPSFTLNASETTARGCAITAAMLSPKFQVREFRVAELPTYPLLLGYYVENPKNPMSVSFLPDVNKVATLVGAGDHFPKTLDVTIANPGPVRIYAYCDPDNENVKGVMLPGRYVIGSWEIGRYKGKVEGEVREIKVRITLKPDSMIHVDNAWAIDVHEVEAAPAPAAAPAADGAEAPAAPEEPKKQTKRKLHEVTLSPQAGVLGHESAQVVAFCKAEKEMNARDQRIIRTREARNELESYILDFRGKLSAGGQLADYVAPAARDAFVAQCNADEEWLYGDGDAATMEEYAARVAQLRAVGDAAQARYKNRDDLEFALKGFNTALADARQTALAAIGKKAHITEEELRAAAATADAALEWGTQEVQAVLAAPKTEDRAFTSRDLQAKVEEVTRGITAVVNKPAPPPPKEEKKKEAQPPAAPAEGTADAAEAPAPAPEAPAPAPEPRGDELD